MSAYFSHYFAYELVTSYFLYAISQKSLKRKSQKDTRPGIFGKNTLIKN